MNFLGMGLLEILVVFFIAFVVLGPERMVDMSRKAGRMVGDLRRMNSGLRESLTIEDLEEEPKPQAAPTEPADKEPSETAEKHLHEGPVDFRAWRASRIDDSADAGEGSDRGSGGDGGDGGDGDTIDDGGGGAGPNGVVR